MDILKNVKDQLSGEISEATFEGANIVLYTKNEDFFKEGEGKIKKIVDQIKKRIELRSDQEILLSQEKTEKEIKKIIPEEAEITNIIFDAQRSIVVIEAKKPGLVIGKGGSILEDIKQKTLWTSQVQRSPAIKSQITENIREVLYENNNYRRRFLNSIGKKIYEELKRAGIRTELSEADETLGKRIREAQMQKIPYILIVGDKEKGVGSVSVRHYKRGEEKEIALSKLLEKMKDEIEKKAA